LTESGAMPARRRLTFLRQRIRRALVVGVALVGYLAGVIGSPVPPSVHKASSVAFPCQNHACGCMTAQQCWQHCCCFSPEEKTAWAQAHQVQPPPEAQTAQGWNQPRQRDREQHGKASCCGGHHGADQAGTPDSKPAERTKTTTWVLGMMSQQCGGASTSWLLGEPVSAPPALVSWTYDASPVCWLQPCNDPPTSAALVPPIPPPRG
jgi:hypothetical protein